MEMVEIPIKQSTVQKMFQKIGNLHSILQLMFICLYLYNPKCTSTTISHINLWEGRQLSVHRWIIIFLLVIPKQDLLSDFKDLSRWNNIWDGFRFASLDSTILLDSLCIPNDNYNAIAIVNGFYWGTSSDVSDKSFCIESPIGPSGTSSVIVTLETDCDQNLYAMGTK